LHVLIIDLPFFVIYDIINGENEDLLPPEKWRDIAPRLGISHQKIDQLRTKATLHNFSTQEAYTEVFKIWREEQGRNATVGKLITALEGVKLKAPAGCIIHF